MDEAVRSAHLTVDTVQQIADRVPDAALRRTFLAWRRVETAREDVERVLLRHA
jgi:hypothetical protein